MGIVNVTPDSFSDGGAFLRPRPRSSTGWSSWREGAEILDIGGESTRPGAEPVPAGEELRRVVPVIEGLAAADGCDARPPADLDRHLEGGGRRGGARARARAS